MNCKTTNCKKEYQVPTFKFVLRADLKNNKEFLPSRAHDTDTGWDVRVATEDHNDLIIYDNEKVLIPLGFKVFSPPGWWLKVVPRSSTFAKKHLNCLYGTVDESYEGYVYLSCMFQHPTSVTRDVKKLILPFGERIAQLIPVKREEMIVEEISDEDYEKHCNQRAGSRGAGGFGSSGNK